MLGCLQTLLMMQCALGSFEVACCCAAGAAEPCDLLMNCTQVTWSAAVCWRPAAAGLPLALLVYQCLVCREMLRPFASTDCHALALWQAAQAITWRWQSPLLSRVTRPGLRAGCLQEAARLFPAALAAAQHDVPVADALERAGEKQGLGHTQVEEVRMVLRMGPIFLLTILYWTIYSQMASVFVIQAKYMDRDIDIAGYKYTLPAASMTMFDTFAIITMIPIYDGIVVPLLKRLRCQLSLLQRIGWGFVLAAAAMLAAAVVERRRMVAIVEHDSNVGVMQQVTPYVLVGASEVLSSIGQIEFFYDQVRIAC